jgi:hypothetical protein
VVGITLTGFTMVDNASNLSSGTDIIPTLGSMVQKGKLADWAFAFDKQLNRVDFPTLGKPTIPHFNAITIIFLRLAKIEILTFYYMQLLIIAYNN